MTVLLTLGLSVGTALPAMADTTAGGVVTLTGTVRHQGVGQAGVTVCVLVTNSCGVTAGDGSYTIAGIAPGPSRLTATPTDAAFVETWFPSFSSEKNSVPVLISQATVGNESWDFELASAATGNDQSLTATSSTAAVVASAKPKIAGTARAGKKLTVKVTKSAGVKLKYQWYLNGKKISGATKAGLKVAKAYRGKKVTVKVTFTKQGLTSVTKASAAKKVR